MNKHDASRIAREGLDQTLETGAETVREAQEGLSTAVDNARDFNLKLIEMAQENTVAAFDFAREVAGVKAPSDLAEIWTTHATKQFDRWTKQASTLTTIGQQFASKAESATRRAAKR